MMILFTHLPALLCPPWFPGCDGRGDSLRDSTGDLDVVLTGTWRKHKLRLFKQCTGECVCVDKGFASYCGGGGVML